MTIELGINHVPTHGLLNDIKVIRNIDFRYWVLEMVAPVMTTSPVSMMTYKRTEGYKEKFLRHDFLKGRPQRRFMGEKRACQQILQRLELIPFKNFSFVCRIRQGAYTHQVVPKACQLLLG